MTLEDLAVPAESQRFMAARAKSQTVEIGASHAVTVSEPDAVADLILAAVPRDPALTPGRAAGSRCSRARCSTRTRNLQITTRNQEVPQEHACQIQNATASTVAGRWSPAGRRGRARPWLTRLRELGADVYVVARSMPERLRVPRPLHRGRHHDGRGNRRRRRPVERGRGGGHPRARRRRRVDAGRRL